MLLPSHMTVFEKSASEYPDLAAFRLPVIDDQTGQVKEWTDVAYKHFWVDIQSCARMWSRILRCEGIPRRSVIGVWYVALSLHEVNQ